MESDVKILPDIIVVIAVHRSVLIFHLIIIARLRERF